MFLMRVAGAALAALEIEPQEARFGLRQIDVVAAAVAGLDAEGGLPVLPVVGDLDVVGAGEVLLGPVDHQAAVLAHLLEVELQPLLLGDRRRCARRSPGRRRARRRPRLPSALVEALQLGRQVVGPEVALAEAQLVDPHRALAAAAGGDRELDRGDPPQLAAVRAPGELDVALLDRQLAPVARRTRNGAATTTRRSGPRRRSA